MLVQDFIARLNFTEVLLNIFLAILNLSIIIGFTFIKKDNKFRMLPFVLTYYTSIMLLIFINIFSRNFYITASFFSNIFNYILLIIFLSAFFVYFNKNSEFFNYMKMPLKLFLLFNLFIFGVFISNSIILNLVLLVFVILVYTINNFYFKGYYPKNNKENRMKIVYSSFAIILPAIMNAVLLNMNMVNFKINHIHPGHHGKLALVLFTFIVVIWNFVVLCYNMCGINIYNRKERNKQCS